MDPVDLPCKILLAVGTLDQLLLAGVLAEEVILNLPERFRTIPLRGRNRDSHLEVAAGDGAVQQQLAVLLENTTNLLLMLEVYVRNYPVGRFESLFTKLTFK